MLENWKERTQEIDHLSSAQDIKPLLDNIVVQKHLEHAAWDYEFQVRINKQQRPELFLMGLTDTILEDLALNQTRYDSALEDPLDPQYTLCTMFQNQSNQELTYGEFRAVLENALGNFLAQYSFENSSLNPLQDNCLAEEDVLNWYAARLPDLDSQSDIDEGNGEAFRDTYKSIFPACSVDSLELKTTAIALSGKDNDSIAEIMSPAVTLYPFQREVFFALLEHLQQGGAVLAPEETIIPQYDITKQSFYESLTPGTYTAGFAPCTDTNKVLNALSKADFKETAKNTFSRKDLTLIVEPSHLNPDIKLAHPVVRAHLVLPTGTGKTVIFVETLEHLHGKNSYSGQEQRPAFVAVHSRGLRGQTIKEIATHAPHLNVKDLGDRNFEKANIVIGTYKRLQKECERGLDLNKFSILILDEIHQSLGRKTRITLQNALSNAPLVPAIGLTATESYSDDEGRHAQFLLPQELYRMFLIEGQERGFLCPSKGEVIDIVTDSHTADLDENGKILPVKSNKVLSEALKEEAFSKVCELLDRPDISKANTLLFVRKIKDAHALKRILETKGVQVQAITGENNEQFTKERENFQSSESGVLILTPWGFQGADLPTASVAICLDDTTSKIDRKQMLGRLLRRDVTNPLKEALFIEFRYPQLGKKAVFYNNIIHEEEELQRNYSEERNYGTFYKRAIGSREYSECHSIKYKNGVAILRGSTIETLDDKTVSNLKQEWVNLFDLGRSENKDFDTCRATISTLKNAEYLLLSSLSVTDIYLAPKTAEDLTNVLRTLDKQNVAVEHEYLEQNRAFALELRERFPLGIRDYQQIISSHIFGTEVETLPQSHEETTLEAQTIEIQRLKGETLELMIMLILETRPTIPQPLLVSDSHGIFYPDFLIPGDTQEIGEVKYGLAPQNVRDSVAKGVNYSKKEGTNYTLWHLKGDYSRYETEHHITVNRCDSASLDETLLSPSIKKVLVFLQTNTFSSEENREKLENINNALHQLYNEHLGLPPGKEAIVTLLSMNHNDFIKAATKKPELRNKAELLFSRVLEGEFKQEPHAALPLGLLGYDKEKDKLFFKRSFINEAEILRDLSSPKLLSFLKKNQHTGTVQLSEHPDICKEIDKLFVNFEQVGTKISANPASIALLNIAAKRFEPQIYTIVATPKDNVPDYELYSILLAEASACFFASDFDSIHFGKGSEIQRFFLQLKKVDDSLEKSMRSYKDLKVILDSSEHPRSDEFAKVAKLLPPRSDFKRYCPDELTTKKCELQYEMIKRLAGYSGFVGSGYADSKSKLKAQDAINILTFAHGKCRANGELFLEKNPHHDKLMEIIKKVNQCFPLKPKEGEITTNAVLALNTVYLADLFLTNGWNGTPRNITRKKSKGFGKK